MEVCSQVHVSTTLPQGKSPSYSMDRRLIGPMHKVFKKKIFVNAEELSTLVHTLSNEIGKWS